MVRALLSTADVVLLEPLTKLRALVFANVGLQLLDGHLTLRGLAQGFNEGNPVVREMMGFAGDTGGILIMKVAAIATLLLLYRRARRHPLTVTALATLAVAYFVFAIVPWTMLLSASGG